MICLQAERCSLFLVDKKSKELVAKVFDGNTLADGSTEVGSDNIISLSDNIKFCLQQTEVRLPLDTGIVGHVVKTGQLINVHNVYKNHLFYKGCDQETGFKTRYELSIIEIIFMWIEPIIHFQKRVVFSNQ